MGRRVSRKALAFSLGAILSFVIGAFFWLTAVLNASFSAATDLGERFQSAGKLWTYGGWIMFVVAIVLVIAAIKSSRSGSQGDRITDGA